MDPRLDGGGVSPLDPPREAVGVGGAVLSEPPACLWSALANLAEARA